MEERCSSMMEISKMKKFRVRRRQTRPNGRFRNKFGVLTHNVEKTMTRRAPMLPLEAQAQRVIMRLGGKARHLEQNYFVANVVFK